MASAAPTGALVGPSTQAELASHPSAQAASATGVPAADAASPRKVSTSSLRSVGTAAGKVELQASLPAAAGLKRQHSGLSTATTSSHGGCKAQKTSHPGDCAADKAAKPAAPAESNGSERASVTDGLHFLLRACEMIDPEGAAEVASQTTSHATPIKRHGAHCPARALC